MSTWENADGVQVRFGQYHSTDAPKFNRARELVVAGALKQLEMDINLTLVPTDGTAFPADLDNDGTKDGFTEHEASLPPYASILRAYIASTETAAGGTSIDIGVFEADGTAIDADGIFDGLVTASLALGEISAGNGELVFAHGNAYANDVVTTRSNVASIGADRGYIAVTGAGTFTAGKARLIIEYLDLLES